MGAMLPPMRELYPNAGDDVDPVARYGADDRTPPSAERPWVMVNMIATVDGATEVDGRSGGLGGPADKLVFGAVRAVADVILVGAGTVRAESYGAPRTPPGKSVPPRLAIVTRSLDIDPEARVFVDAPPDRRTIVVTTEQSDASRRAALAGVADVVIAGTDGVDILQTLGELRGRGARVALCEGGPSLNGQLVATGALDELCLSVAPLLAGGASPRLAHGLAPPEVFPMRLDRVLEADDMLFLRYVRSTQVSAASARLPS
jgi:riboflavin biosynthesis pyrimidine reductase